jgi:hypothetical protein
VVHISRSDPVINSVDQPIAGVVRAARATPPSTQVERPITLPRLRPMSGRRHHRPEDQLQRTVCQHLRQRGAPGLVWHTPNGGKRRPVEASILKGLGTRAGVADLIFVHRGRPFALELKADEGRPTVEQIAFVSDFNGAGGSAAIVNGLDRALRTLETWGLLRGTAQGGAVK